MMQKKWLSGAGVLILAGFMLAGCSTDSTPKQAPAQQPPTKTEPSSTTPSAPAAPDAPQTKESILTLEGSAQPITLKKYDAHTAAPFRTYYPEDMIAEQNGQAIQFIANFAGKRNNNIFVKVEFPAGLISEQEAVAWVKKNADVTEESAEKSHSWTKKEFNLDRTKDGVDYGGSVLIGEHGGHYFVVTVYMPVEAAEGLGVRADKIFEEWVWTDDQKPLMQK